MKPLDNLFNLIHSLDDDEIKYFRAHASRHIIGNKNNYEKLFDLFLELPADKPYDENQLKKLLKNKSFGKNLAVEKKNLYDLILEALRIYGSDKSRPDKLTASIGNLRFLQGKGLLNEGGRELEKAFDLARETENLPALILLYNIKHQLTIFPQSKEDIKEEQDDFDTEKLTLRMLTNERHAVHIRRHVYNLYISNSLGPHIKELKENIKKIIDETAGLQLTHYTKTSLLATRALIAEKEGDYAGALKLYEEMLVLAEKSPLNLYQPLPNLRAILGNYLVCAYYCERLDIFPGIISKIEKIPCKNREEEAEGFTLTRQFRLVYLINSPERGVDDKLIQEIETGCEKYASFIPATTKINFFMNINIYYIQRRRFNELIDNINKTYELIGRDKRFYALLCNLKFFEIMAHISLKNYDVCSYQLDNTERWLRENDLNNEFTNTLIKFLRDLKPGNPASKTNGQLADAGCPPEMLMLKEITIQWLSGN